MIGAILSRLGGARLLGGLVLGLGVVSLVLAGVLHYRGLQRDLAQARVSVQQLTTDRDAAIAAAEVNAQSLYAVTRAAQQSAALLARDRDAALARADQYQRLSREIARHEDAPAAPVLRAAVAGLRCLRTPRPDGCDAGGDDPDQPAR